MSPGTCLGRWVESQCQCLLEDQSLHLGVLQQLPGPAWLQEHGRAQRAVAARHIGVTAAEMLMVCSWGAACAPLLLLQSTAPPSVSKNTLERGTSSLLPPLRVSHNVGIGLVFQAVWVQSAESIQWVRQVQRVLSFCWPTKACSCEVQLYKDSTASSITDLDIFHITFALCALLNLGN